jgi:predicted nuclease of predicted toxin-antitoxin system
MKLLFDQNVSPLLANRLSDLFPGSVHVSTVGLERADDVDIWLYATENSFVIVTKDADFSDMGVVRGSPPKVLWLRLGNCTTSQIETVLRTRFTAIEEFCSEEIPVTLILV